MDWTARIGRYCERVDAGYWGEPVNAISNLAFLIAALAAFALWRARGRGDRATLALIFAGAAVGVGSYLFHTHATPWAWLADVVPIAVFIAGYFLLVLLRFAGLGLALGLCGLVLFEAVTVATLRAFPPPFLNGSAGYLPALGALVLVGIGLRAGRGAARAAERDRSAATTLFAAAVLFAVSLVFRIVDLDVCPTFPLGTHFLWHLFNASVIYVLLRGAILHSAAARR